jgi:hypothetical protein
MKPTFTRIGLNSIYGRFRLKIKKKMLGLRHPH